MLFDLLFEVAFATFDRPDHRTRLEQAAVYLGLVAVLLGVWIAIAGELLVGATVAVAGGGLWLTGVYRSRRRRTGV